MYASYNISYTTHIDLNMLLFIIIYIDKIYKKDYFNLIYVLPILLKSNL